MPDYLIQAQEPIEFVRVRLPVGNETDPDGRIHENHRFLTSPTNSRDVWVHRARAVPIHEEPEDADRPRGVRELPNPNGWFRYQLSQHTPPSLPGGVFHRR
jgi:hypothetical protein